MNLESLQTEQRDPATVDLDRYSTEELLYLMNTRDHGVLAAVRACIGDISQAVDEISPRIQKNGRLIYIGAGTSGRLGILDAAEVPPTFSAPVDQFVAIIAGGEAAVRVAQEGAEDSKELAYSDLDKLNLAPNDTVIGIAASGRTPYVQGGLEYARRKNVLTVAVVCVYEPTVAADIVIKAVPGPEIITGSTRLKAGTATKLVLNMISTCVMIKIGKTYGNLMIDLKPTNAKLRQRSRMIFRAICSPEKYPKFSDDALLEEHFEKCKFNLKVAVLSVLANLEPAIAQQALDQSNGLLEKALTMNKNETDHKLADDIIDAKRIKPEKDLLLVIDGGGSKTAALIRSKQGEFRGLGGPSNTATHPVQHIIDTVKSAVENCLTKLDGNVPRQLQKRFSKVWVGLAGYMSCSQAIRDSLQREFTQLFGVSGPKLMISGDSTLLAGALNSPKYSEFGVDTCVTAIAGTGSSIMAFRAVTDSGTKTVDYKLIARLGGLGPILGDEAGGYAIGLCAIKNTLKTLELCAITGENADEKLSELQKKIINHFNRTSHTFTADILKVVSSSYSVTKIAAVARLVLERASADIMAHDILTAAVGQMVESVQLIIRAPSISCNKSLLVLGGALFQRVEYRNLFTSLVAKKSLSFHNIVCIENAASVAADSLEN